MVTITHVKMSTIGKIIRYISNAGGVFTSIGITVIMLGTALDGLGRYLFGRPIPGIVELSEPLLAAAIFLGLASTEALHRHVSVTILSDRLPQKHRAVLQVVRHIIVILFMGAMGYYTLLNAIVSYSFREVVPYGIVPIPIWWAKFSISIGCFMLCVQCAAELVQNRIGRT